MALNRRLPARCIRALGDHTCQARIPPKRDLQALRPRNPGGSRLDRVQDQPLHRAPPRLLRTTAPVVRLRLANMHTRRNAGAGAGACPWRIAAKLAPDELDAVFRTNAIAQYLLLHSPMTPGQKTSKRQRQQRLARISNFPATLVAYARRIPATTLTLRWLSSRRRAFSPRCSLCHQLIQDGYRTRYRSQTERSVAPGTAP